MERNPSRGQEGTGLLVTRQAFRPFSPPATLSPSIPRWARLKPRTTSTRAPHSAPKCNFRVPYNCPLPGWRPATFGLPQMLALLRDVCPAADAGIAKGSRGKGQQNRRRKERNPRPLPAGGKESTHSTPACPRKACSLGWGWGGKPQKPPWPVSHKPRLRKEPRPKL